MNYFSLSALTSSMTTQDGLKHAVLQSLLNHSESTKNDRARMNNDERGGVWSEQYAPSVGSRDWTLAREKNTAQTASRAKRFYEEALAWLVDAGHVQSINVQVAVISATALARSVTLTLNDGSQFEVPL